MSDIDMHTHEVIAASHRLREGDEELRPAPNLNRAGTFMADLPDSSAGHAWPGAARGIASAFERFRQSNSAIAQKLVASAHAYEHHETANAAAIRSIEA